MKFEGVAVRANDGLSVMSTNAIAANLVVQRQGGARRGAQKS